MEVLVAQAVLQVIQVNQDLLVSQEQLLVAVVAVVVAQLGTIQVVIQVDLLL